jgi:hypothetical protein
MKVYMPPTVKSFQCDGCGATGYRKEPDGTLAPAFGWFTVTRSKRSTYGTDEEHHLCGTNCLKVFVDARWKEEG